MIASLVGRLLVATPLLEEPTFARTVVLVCSHTEEGALGLVLNRPLGEPTALHLPEWTTRSTEPAVFFAGGPVQRHVVMGLGLDRSMVDAGWWTRVTDEVGLIDLRFAPKDLGDSISSARLFVGYAGWGAGQLEGEIAGDAWWVVDSRASDALGEHPETLWGDVLRRQRGRKRELAFYANTPADPRWN